MNLVQQPAEQPARLEALHHAGQRGDFAGQHGRGRSVARRDPDLRLPGPVEGLLRLVERQPDDGHATAPDCGVDHPSPLEGDPQRVFEHQRARDAGGGDLADAVPDDHGRFDTARSPERGQRHLHRAQGGLAYSGLSEPGLGRVHRQLLQQRPVDVLLQPRLTALQYRRERWLGGDQLTAEWPPARTLASEREHHLVRGAGACCSGKDPGRILADGERSQLLTQLFGGIAHAHQALGVVGAPDCGRAADRLDVSGFVSPVEVVAVADGEVPQRRVAAG